MTEKRSWIPGREEAVDAELLPLLQREGHALEELGLTQVVHPSRLHIAKKLTIESAVYIDP